MKLPFSKSTAVALGGVLLIGGTILAAEWNSLKSPEVSRDSTRGRDADARRGRARAIEGKGAAPRGSAAAQTCPTENTVEDPTLKADPEFIKARFRTGTCSETGAGELNGCIDVDQAACEKRLSNLTRMLKNPGRCLARPAQVYCETLVMPGERHSSFCFETREKCDQFRERKQARGKICRMNSTCELVTLPPP
ncbi:MAG TPA: hypothetical protein VFS00_12390 [Polyangiaceae bacterium]|nr:hypothetical protein [Polyangiaceae bacterium]